jgi:hypothetical protein
MHVDNKYLMIVNNHVLYVILDFDKLNLYQIKKKMYYNSYLPVRIELDVGI